MELLNANTPISYGEEAFLQKIQERTKGEREPVGLVLSGGSARAFAHIGVLEALEEQGIVPDFIISNSMGSIISILYASGMSPEQISNLMSGVNISSMLSIQLPLNKGLLSASKLESLVLSLVGESKRLEDLDIPVIIVTEDLVTKRQVLLSEGDLGDVLLASFALPVYFSSVPYSEHLLIDGGIANIAPVQLAYRYTDNVIVSTSFYEGSGLNRKNPITALNISIDIGKRRQAVADLISHPDCLWIRCDVEDFSFMAFNLVSVLSQRGYQALDGVQVPFQSSEPPESLVNHRNEFALSIPDTLKRYSAFGHITMAKKDFALTFKTTSTLDEEDAYFSRQDTVMALQGLYQYKDLSLALATGLAWNAYTMGSVSPVVDLNATWFALYNLKFSFEASAFLSKGNPGFYLRQAIVYRSDEIVDNLRLELGEILEYSHNEGTQSFLFWDKPNLMLSSQASLSYIKPELQMLFKLGCNIQLVEQTKYMGFASFKVESGLVGPIGFNLSTLGRFSFVKDDKVPLFGSDYSRISISEQGKYIGLGTLTLTVNTKKDYSLSLGEIFLIKASYIGLFGQVLWTGLSNSPYAAIGLEAKSTVSLLGLSETDVRLYGGYDAFNRKPVFGLLLGRAF